MRRLLALALITLTITGPLRAQDGGIDGFVLIRALEIGVPDDPNSLFLADAGGAASRSCWFPTKGSSHPGSTGHQMDGVSPF